MISNDIASDNTNMMSNSFTPMFGNLSFQIAPSQTGEVNYSFGEIPYMSVEALIMQQQLNAQTDPTMVSPGQNTGQQNISGQYTVTGGAGNVQVAIGNATNDTGGF